MTEMSFSEAIATLFLGLVVIYLVVRLGSAAYFKSKQIYEKERKNGAQPNQP